MATRSRARVIALPQTAVDPRVWPIVALIGFFGWLVMKEIHLPSAFMAVCVGLGLLGAFMASVNHPELALYVLVAYLPFSRLLVGGFGTGAFALNLTNILTIWVFAIYVIGQLSKGQALFQRAPINWVVLIFCALGVGSLLNEGVVYGSWVIFRLISPMKQWLTPMFFYFLTLWVVRDRKTMKTIAVIMMVAVTIVALMAIRDYLNASGGSLEKSRVGGIAEQPNTLGAFFVYYMFLFLSFFLVYRKKFKTWLLLIPFALSFRGIMVTFSRGAYMGFASGLLGAFWHRNKILFVIVGSLLWYAIANPWLLPAGIRYRMGQTVVRSHADVEDVVETLEVSSGNRVKIWRATIEMIKDHPWWGVGYGAFPAYITPYSGGQFHEVDAHNSYLLIAAELGIPALVIFLIIVGLAWWHTRWLYLRTKDLSTKAIALGFLAGLEGLLVVNMFGSRMDDQAVASYFWVLCALVMRGVLLERQERAQARAVKLRRLQTQLA